MKDSSFFYFRILAILGCPAPQLSCDRRRGGSAAQGATRPPPCAATFRCSFFALCCASALTPCPPLSSWERGVFEWRAGAVAGYPLGVTAPARENTTPSPVRGEGYGGGVPRRCPPLNPARGVVWGPILLDDPRMCRARRRPAAPAGSRACRVGRAGRHHSGRGYSSRPTSRRSAA